MAPIEVLNWDKLVIHLLITLNRATGHSVESELLAASRVILGVSGVSGVRRRIVLGVNFVSDQWLSPSRQGLSGDTPRLVHISIT
jgi:hypothetical protein